MRTTKELFGNVPRSVWTLQYKLAVKRIELAKKQLNDLFDESYPWRDVYAINATAKALKFWETLRDEANNTLRRKVDNRVSKKSNSAPKSGKCKDGQTDTDTARAEQTLEAKGQS